MTAVHNRISIEPLVRLVLHLVRRSIRICQATDRVRATAIITQAMTQIR